MLRPLFMSGLGAIVFGSILWQGLPRRVAELQRTYDIAASPPLSQINPVFIDLLTFGHKAIYDDFINLWLLQILMDTRKPSDPEQLMQSVRSVIRHHPRLETVYMLSCFTMYLEYKRPEFCQEIILAGLQAFPDSWRLPMTQGYVHYFLLKEPAQAASFFMMAASRTQSPDYVKRVVQKLLKENELNADDLQRSMEIMGGTQIGDQFLMLLQSLGKAPHDKEPSEAPRE